MEIHILEKNLDKVSWCVLSGNPNSIHILEKNIDKVDLDELSTNPNILKNNEKQLVEILQQIL